MATVNALSVALFNAAAGGYAAEMTANASGFANAVGPILEKDISTDALFVEHLLGNLGVTTSMAVYAQAKAAVAGLVAAKGRAGAASDAVDFLKAQEGSTSAYATIAADFAAKVNKAAAFTAANATERDITKLVSAITGVDTDVLAINTAVAAQKAADDAAAAAAVAKAAADAKAAAEAAAKTAADKAAADAAAALKAAQDKAAADAATAKAAADKATADAAAALKAANDKATADATAAKAAADKAAADAATALKAAQDKAASDAVAAKAVADKALADAAATLKAAQDKAAADATTAAAALKAVDNTSYASEQAAYDAALAVQKAADDAAAAATKVVTDAAAAKAAADLKAANDQITALKNPAGGTYALSTGADVVIGNSGNDTITAAAGTIGASDVIVDTSTTDNDSLTIAATGNTLDSLGTIARIENVTINADSTGATFTVTSAAAVSSSNLTVNLTRAGGATAVDFDDIGLSNKVTAGTGVADLTVDSSQSISGMTVIGGTGALSVGQGAARKVTNLTVDGSKGTTVGVDWLANSSGLTVIGGSGAVDVTSATKITTLVVDASASSTAAVQVGSLSSGITFKTGSDAATFNNTTAYKVTGLNIDAAALTSTLGVKLLTGSTATVTAPTTAGTITIDSDDTYSGSTATSLTITADVADIASSITDIQTINATLLGSAGTLTLDSDARNVTLNAVTAAQTVTHTTGPIKTVSLAGSKAITFQISARDVDSTDVISVSSTGGANHVLTLNTASQQSDVDLSGVATNVTINLGVDAGAGTGSFTIADGATIKASTAQTTAVLGVIGAAEASTSTLDLQSANHTGGFSYTNTGTLNVKSTATSGNANAIKILVDSDANGTAGNINLTGTKAISLASTSDAAAVTSTAFTGALTATLSSTMKTVTSGSGNDNITVYAGNFTVDGGSGNDTLTAVDAVDLSTRTVSIKNFEILAMGTANMTVANGQLTGSETITGTTGDLTIKGTISNDTISAAGFTNVLTQDVGTNGGFLILDGGAGSDTLVGSAKNDVLKGGTGADKLNGGEGNDYYVGGSGLDAITLTETTSTADYVIFAGSSDGSTAGVTATAFSGFDVITGFVSGTDKILFDSANEANGTTIASAFVAAKVVKAGTAATLNSDDLTASNYTDVDTVVSYLNSAGTAFTQDAQNDVVAVTLAGGTTALYLVTSDGAQGVVAAEVKLLGTVDATLVTGDIVIV